MAAVATAAVSLAVGLLLGPACGFWTSTPAALAVGGALSMLVGGASTRGALAAATGVAATGSLAATTAHLLTGESYSSDDPVASVWAVAETAGLWILILLTIRQAPWRPAVLAGGLAIVAVPAWLLRFGWEPVTAAMVGGYAAWTLAALGAAAVGWYLRALDERRTRSVVQARQSQRSQLARDLHDFVAHDISGMLAQAQAGQVIAEREPAAAAAAFRRIERAGQDALASMDRALEMLRDEDDAGRGPLTTWAGLTELSETVTRFRGTGGPEVRLAIDPVLADHEDPTAAPRELVDTAHRVVVEALTNVRRHAPSATQVEVDVRRSGAGPSFDLEVSVRDDGAPSSARSPERHGGHGLPGLAERVEALGGSLTAGAVQPGGWMVRAVLPFRAATRRDT
jgi:signal transduction histidine kinase